MSLAPEAIAQRAPGSAPVKRIAVGLWDADPSLKPTKAWLSDVIAINGEKSFRRNHVPLTRIVTNGTAPRQEGDDSDPPDMVAYLPDMQTSLRLTLWIEWPKSVRLSIPIFLRADAKGPHHMTIAYPGELIANEATLRHTDAISAQTDLPAALKYYFAGRAVYRGIPDQHKFADVGVHAVRDWFVGSFNAVKFADHISIDSDLLNTISEMIDESDESDKFKGIFQKGFFGRNKSLLRDYVKFPSASGLKIPSAICEKLGIKK